jgi:hypothetical protein
MRPIRARIARLVAVAALALCVSSVQAEKNDVVTMKNGDRLTGEVKSLDRGELSLSTDHLGTVSIEWDAVAFISIEQDIQVETQSGSRYFGRIAAAADEHKVLVETSNGPQLLDGDRVVAMNPIDEGGFRSIDLNVAFGYNFTKASNITQMNVSADAKYRTRKRVLAADFSSSISNTSSTESSQVQSLSFTYTRLRANRWLNDGGISFDRNDELGLNLRTSISAGIGRILMQTNNSDFTLAGGLKATRENDIGVTEDTDSLESYGSVAWQWFRFDDPELDWTTTLEIIPSLTESGRIRGQFDTTLRWEIINDFYWQLDIYDSYDNQPQGDTTTTNDYGVTTSISYKF